MLGACSELRNEKRHCQTADLNIRHTKNAFLFYVLGILWRAESQRDITWTTVRLSICLSTCTMLSQLCKLWWHYGPKQWRTVQLVWPVLYKQFQICTQLQLAMWAYCIFTFLLCGLCLVEKYLSFFFFTHHTVVHHNVSLYEFQINIQNQKALHYLIWCVSCFTVCA